MSEHSEPEKHVWMINHHAAIPAKDGMEGRHFALARHLREHGWSTSLIVASTSHPSGQQNLRGPRLRHVDNNEGIYCLWVRTSRYGSSMALRFVGMLVFALMTLAPGMTRGLPSPDVVIGSTVHPFAAWAGWRLAKRHRVPFIYEIRDVWPETLINLGRLKSSALLARILRKISLSLCAKSDLVLSPLPGVRLYLDENGFQNKEFVWISNGIEPEPKEPDTNLKSHRPFTFLYFGSHGNANALDKILDAFDEALHESSGADIRLHLIGSGPLKPQLINYASQLASAERISFEEPVPRSQIIRRAREADCMIINMRNLPVYKYGVSPNKLFDYLSSGRPIITAMDAPNNPVRDANAGICVRADDSTAMATAMLKLYSTDGAVLRQLGQNGRRHVESAYSYGHLAQRLATSLDLLSADYLHATKTRFASRSNTEPKSE